MDPADIVAQTEIEAVLEALARCNAECKRTLAKDHLGRPNPLWAAKHEYLNYLLECYEDALLQATLGAE